jgi:transposase InsO family protein
MTTRKRHTPEEVLRKLTQADRLLAEGKAMADWPGEGVGLAFIPPGQPWRNGYIESFIGHLRDECLNLHQRPSTAPIVGQTAPPSATPLGRRH